MPRRRERTTIKEITGGRAIVDDSSLTISVEWRECVDPRVPGKPKGSMMCPLCQGMDEFCNLCDGLGYVSHRARERWFGRED